MDGDFAALEALLDTTFYTADRAGYVVRFGLVDSGYRTDTVYEFCRRVQKVAPSKGAAAKRTPISYTKIDTYPGTGRIIPGGVQLVNFDANFFKDALDLRLQVGRSDTGAWLLHRDTDEEYARQYTSEYHDEETGLWQQRGNQPNHLWDCGVLQLVALRILATQGVLERLLRDRDRTARQPAASEQPRTPQRSRLW